MDTIFALSTAPGKAGVAVIRLSGPDAFAAAGLLGAKIKGDRKANLCSIQQPGGQVLDQALVIGFSEPASFTGEDVVELHLHGSKAVVDAVSQCLSQTGICRPAKAGEFTLRAMQNNKLDLTQVEGLADLLEAQTELQRRAAMNVLRGSFQDFVSQVRSKLVRSAALIEAVIDFADEETPEDVTEEVLMLLGDVVQEVTRQLDGLKVSERIREGFRIAIVGPPNSGKSTLLNYLAGREMALTSEVAGTTRDVIEVHMDLEGIPVTLLDTAGLRETTDQVEALGIQKAESLAREADLRVFLDPEKLVGNLVPTSEDICLTGKDDSGSLGRGGISGLTGEGTKFLLDSVVATLSNRVGMASVASNARHRATLEYCLRAAETAIATVSKSAVQYDLAADDLRSAIHGFDELVGRVDVEELLGEIFSSFCIGK